MKTLIHVVALALLLSTQPSLARSRPVELHGKVRSAASRQPIAGVVVTLRSPELGIELSTVTNARGEYAFTQLTPGTYTVSFEKEPFLTYARSQLRLRSVLKGDVELVPEGYDGAMDVSEENPVAIIMSKS